DFLADHAGRIRVALRAAHATDGARIDKLYIQGTGAGAVVGTNGGSESQRGVHRCADSGRRSNIRYRITLSGISPWTIWSMAAGKESRHSTARPFFLPAVALLSPLRGCTATTSASSCSAVTAGPCKEQCGEKGSRDLGSRTA